MNGVNVRVAEADAFAQARFVRHEFRADDFLHGLNRLREPVFKVLGEPLVSGRVVHQAEVLGENEQVALGEAHLGIVQHGAEERPLGVHFTGCIQADAVQSFGEAVPAGEVQAVLRPTHDPGNGAEVLQGGRSGAAHGATGDVQA